MSRLEDLKVETKDISKVKNELTDVWGGLQKYGLSYISKNTTLSLADIRNNYGII